MKKLFILAAAIFIAAAAVKAQTVFVLQNGNNRTLFFEKINDVMTILQNGDTLYLPAKPIIGTGNGGDFDFNKEIHIIGAGYHPDTAAVTGITKMTRNLNFNKGSKGSTITGVRVEGDVFVRDSAVTITRCNMNNIEIQNGTNPISQTYVSDCVIRVNVNGSNDVVTNTLFERCVISGQIGSGNKSNQMMVKNCLLLFKGNYNSYSGLLNLTIQNSIILCPAYFIFCSGYGNFNSGGLTLKNNLWVRSQLDNTSTFVMQNNIFGIPETDIFMDKDNGDYRIKPTLTQALTLATDGKEVGIFGTDYPFLVPTFAPRFISIDNAENVVNGKLSVKMRVEARDR